MTTMEQMEARYNKIGRSLKDLIHNYEAEDGKGNKLKLYKYKESLFPPFGDLSISKMKTAEIRDDDIHLAGYPKTGCHWTFEILAMILQRRPKNEGIGKIVGFLEMCAPEVVAAQASPRILNSHVRFGQLPDQMHSKKTKIILTVRNPKDTLVSYYNHHANLVNLYGYQGTFGDYFDLFLKGQVDYGCYFDYYADWERALKQNKDHPIIVMSYEEMKQDLPREVRRLADFLGIELPDSLVEEIARAGGFESMKEAGNLSHHITRKGQVGDWKNWLTVAQNDVMDSLIAERMAGLTIYKPRFTLEEDSV